ncbi:MAG: SHOCT domain-containing protein [Nocardioidaceae bacterium]
MLVLGGLPAVDPGSDPLQDCIDQGMEQFGQPPTCTEVDGTFVPSMPDDEGMPGSGLFVVFFLFVIIVGVGSMVWRMSTARKIAERSGMDPDLASNMTLLGDHGLEATYLAANLKQPSQATPRSPGVEPRSTAVRLAELKSLLDQGLITQAEYDERRQAIIDAV